MGARAAVFLAVISSLALTASPAASARAASPPPAARYSPGGTGISGGALFGSTEQMVPEESVLGRKLAIIRVYKSLGNVFPDTAEKAMLAAGSTMMVSLDLRDNQTYAEVASGQFDSQILSFFKLVNAAAVKYGLGSIYVDFEHEPSIKKREIHGTPPQFVAAWQHVWQLVDNASLDWQNGGRLHWVWIMDHDSYNPSPTPGQYGPGTAPLFWPGSAYVDIAAVDAYNHPGCHQHQPPGSTVFSPKRLFGSALAFAQSHGNLPVYITEFASIPYPDASIRPAWIDSMTSFITAHPVIIAADYWDGYTNPGSTCTFNINNDPASLAAFARMGQALTGSVIPPGQRARQRG
jgi:hypothetical protein